MQSYEGFCVARPGCAPTTVCFVPFSADEPSRLDVARELEDIIERLSKEEDLAEKNSFLSPGNERLTR